MQESLESSSDDEGCVTVAVANVQETASVDDLHALEESFRDLQLTGVAYPDVELLPEGLLPSETCSQYDEAAQNSSLSTSTGSPEKCFDSELQFNNGCARMSSTGSGGGTRVCGGLSQQLPAMSSTGFEGTRGCAGLQHPPDLELSSTGFEGSARVCGGPSQQSPAMSSTGFEATPTSKTEPVIDHRSLPALRRAKAKITVKLQDIQLHLVLRGRLVSMLALINLYLDKDLQFGWIKASQFAARAAGKGTNFARNLRYWVLLLVRYGIYPVRKTSKKASFMPQGEDLNQLIHLHLLEISKEGHIHAQDIVNFLQTPAMRAHIGSDGGLTIRGAQRWMEQMGWRYGTAKNGMYKDGHESPEVVEYRKAFCNRWVTDYAPRMHVYGNNGELVSNPTTVDLRNGRFPLILVTHDESTFYANDRRKTGWHHPDANVPQPKGEGQSVMVSDFLTPNWGRLKDGEQ